jgi:hypothetical protein
MDSGTDLDHALEGNVLFALKFEKVQAVQLESHGEDL